MRELILSVFLAVGFGTMSRVGAQTSSLCEVGNQAFENHVITIGVRLAFGYHGVALTSDACPRDTRAMALFLPEDSKLPVSFRLDSGAESLLQPFFNRDRGVVPKACGSLRGQIFRKPRFRLQSEAGQQPQGNGYGYRGIYEYAFVLQSVESIRPCD
jgi:hypothetical protein